MANSQIVQSVREDGKQVEPLVYFCISETSSVSRVALGKLDEQVFTDGTVWIILNGRMMVYDVNAEQKGMQPLLESYVQCYCLEPKYLGVVRDTDMCTIIR